MEEIRIGISACLLGENVRYDGGHKRDSFLADVLGPFVSFVKMCPEVEIGLGTPRETVRLVRSPDGENGGNAVRMVAPKSGGDHTVAMRRYAKRKADELDRLDLCGFVLKKDSPSCGMARVRVYDPKGVPAKNGRGLFAAALMERHPDLPVEEEGRLNDPRLRENFIERVFAYRRLTDLFAPRWTVGKLVEFHTREKLLLLAHDVTVYRELGRLVATAKGRPRQEVEREYRVKFMGALARRATVKKHRNVLEHILGHFKKVLTKDEKQNLLGQIDDFASGLVPLIVPVTLLRHFVMRHGVSYLDGQTYLQPHPKELMLRNQV